MCKLYLNVDIENEKLARKFYSRAIPHLTEKDDDGLGVCTLGENGLHVKRYLDVPSVIRRKFDRFLLPYKKALRIQESESGEMSRRLYAVGIHSRYATCEKTLENVHPFQSGGVTLAHNGVITNHNEFKKSVSTCDSEALLSRYIEKGVKDNPDALTDALDGVGGYYASWVFNPDGSVMVFRDDTAPLHIAHVRGVGIVFCTSKEIIKAVARSLRLRVTGMEEMESFTWIKWERNHRPLIGSFENKKPIPAPVASGVGFGSSLGWRDDSTSNYQAWTLEDEERRIERIAELKGINADVPPSELNFDHNG